MMSLMLTDFKGVRAPPESEIFLIVNVFGAPIISLFVITRGLLRPGDGAG